MAATLFEELETRGETRAITKFLETRFGEVPQDICDRIASCTDLKKLDTLTRLAASCGSIDEFRQGLK